MIKDINVKCPIINARTGWEQNVTGELVVVYTYKNEERAL